MSFKDLGNKTSEPRVETPAEAELRAKAAAHHKAKEEKRAAHGAGKPDSPATGTPAKGDPTRR
jgi:hypothetical protein